MRFLGLMRSRAQGDPTEEVFRAVQRLAEEATAAGVLVDMGGLSAADRSLRVRVVDGAVQTVSGPFPDTANDFGAYAIFDVPSQAEAVNWAHRFMDAHQQHWPGWQGELELRQMFQPGEPA